MQLEVITKRPKNPSHPTTPLLFVHSMRLGAWAWAEHYLPYFAEQGCEAHVEKTTCRYLHTSPAMFARIKSPLNIVEGRSWGPDTKWRIFSGNIRNLSVVFCSMFCHGDLWKSDITGFLPIPTRKKRYGWSAVSSALPWQLFIAKKKPCGKKCAVWPEGTSISVPAAAGTDDALWWDPCAEQFIARMLQALLLPEFCTEITIMSSNRNNFHFPVDCSCYSYFRYLLPVLYAQEIFRASTILGISWIFNINLSVQEISCLYRTCWKSLWPNPIPVTRYRTFRTPNQRIQSNLIFC